MAEKIDPALVQLARENYLHGFLQGGCAIIQTSTCTDMPACIPLSGERDFTPYLYASIAAAYERLVTGSTYCCRKERIGYLSDLYDRSVRTIETALATTTPST